jgi:hypothetical protein
VVPEAPVIPEPPTEPAELPPPAPVEPIVAEPEPVSAEPIAPVEPDVPEPAAEREPLAPPSPPSEAAAPAPPAPMEERTPAPSAPTEPPRAPINPFLSRDPRQKARRLARALVSDMIVYQPDKRQQSLAAGTLKEDFEEEIKKSWQEYVEQVGEDMANSTPFFTEALNEILAGGQQLF